MEDFFSGAVSKIQRYWKSSTLLQKCVILGLVVVFFLVIVAFAFFNTAPSRFRIFGGEISDEMLQKRISASLDSANVAYTVGADGKVFYVESKKVARKARALLVREGLTPGQIDPWNLFDIQRWTSTQLEQSVNLQRSLTQQLKLHLESLEDIDSANVTLAFPKDRLFSEEKEPVTASVVVTAKPGSDVVNNQRKIQGIVRLVQFAVPELKPENITITDTDGILLNDFSMLDIRNQLDRINVELEQKRKQERIYYKKIKEALAAVVSVGRVRVINVEYQINTDHVTRTDREVTPIVLVPDNPLTPYSELQITKNVLASRQSSDVDFKGSGFNPEGPPGQEGQTPPAYQDLQSATGAYKQANSTENYVYNQVDSKVLQTPWKRERISVSVAIDGTWNVSYSSDGTVNREYVPIPTSDVEKIRDLVRAAVGYDPTRGDQVIVEEIQFDRSAQFSLEDAAYQRRKLLTGPFMMWVLLGFLVLFFLVFLCYLLAKERERRRRLREADLARQHQAMREAALRSLEVGQNDMVSGSGDAPSDGLRDHAMSLARERPEDVAQLIRTWLGDE